jgi:hypothetical protein
MTYMDDDEYYEARENGIFKTKGEEAQTLLVRDYMLGIPRGHIATLEELSVVADSRPEHISAIKSCVNMLKNNPLGFWLVQVPNGYKVGTPEEILHESTVVYAKKFARTAERGKRAANAAMLHKDANEDIRREATQASTSWSETGAVARRQLKSIRSYRREMPMYRSSFENS